MVIELSGPVEEELRDLAQKQDREIAVLVEEAVREYLEADAITDLDTAAVGETQLAVLGELEIDIGAEPEEPPKETPIWRYVDFESFVAVLERGGLYLSRADLLGDPLGAPASSLR